MKINWVKVADVAERTFGTFWQTFLAIFIVSGAVTGQVLTAAALAGGLAAAKYLVVQLNIYLGVKGNIQGDSMTTPPEVIQHVPDDKAATT